MRAPPSRLGAPLVAGDAEHHRGARLPGYGAGTAEARLRACDICLVWDGADGCRAELKL